MSWVYPPIHKRAVDRVQKQVQTLTGNSLSPHVIAGDTPRDLIVSDETPFILCGWRVLWERTDPAEGDMCVVSVRGKPYLARCLGGGEVMLRCPDWEGHGRIVQPCHILGRVVSAHKAR